MLMTEIKRELLERINEDPIRQDAVLHLLTDLRERIESVADAEFIEYASRYFNFWSVHDHVLKHPQAFRDETYNLIQEINTVVPN